MERLTRITDQLVEGAYAFEVVYGPDCSSPSWNEQVQATDEGFSSMPPNALCCSMGHYEMMKRVVALSLPHALILEDDADLQASSSAVEALVEELPAGWHIAYIGENKDYGVAERTEWMDGGIVTKSFRQASALQYGSFAYLISREGAEYFLREGLPIFTPIDCMFRFRAQSLKAFALLSPVAGLDQSSANGVRPATEELSRERWVAALSPMKEPVCHFLLPFTGNGAEEAWCSWMAKFLTLPHTFTFVSLAGDANYGLSMNAAYTALREDLKGGYLCFHSPFMFPEDLCCDYSKTGLPTSTMRYRSDRNYRLSEDGLEGVSLWLPEHFEKVGGFAPETFERDCLEWAGTWLEELKIPSLVRHGRYLVSSRQPLERQGITYTEPALRKTALLKSALSGKWSPGKYKTLTLEAETR
jgi:GR25 family glycosyltransferase involved in LPS biosynthesis